MGFGDLGEACSGCFCSLGSLTESPRVRHFNPVPIPSAVLDSEEGQPPSPPLSPRGSQGARELRAEQRPHGREALLAVEGHSVPGPLSAVWTQARPPSTSPAPQTLGKHSQLGQQGRSLLLGLPGGDSGLAPVALELGTQSSPQPTSTPLTEGNPHPERP